MQKELLEQWSRLTEASFKSLKELGEINARLTGRLTQHQVDALNAFAEAGVKQAQLVTHPRSYQEAVTEQASLAADYSEKVAEITRETAEVMRQSNEVLVAWAKKGIQEAQQIGPEAVKAARAASKVA